MVVVPATPTASVSTAALENPRARLIARAASRRSSHHGTKDHQVTLSTTSNARFAHSARLRAESIWGS